MKEKETFDLESDLYEASTVESAFEGDLKKGIFSMHPDKLGRIRPGISMHDHAIEFGRQ